MCFYFVSLGEVLRGDRIVNTPYVVSYRYYNLFATRNVNIWRKIFIIVLTRTIMQAIGTHKILCK